MGLLLNIYTEKTVYGKPLYNDNYATMMGFQLKNLTFKEPSNVNLYTRLTYLVLRNLAL